MIKVKKTWQRLITITNMKLKIIYQIRLKNLHNEHTVVIRITWNDGWVIVYQYWISRIKIKFKNLKNIVNSSQKQIHLRCPRYPCLYLSKRNTYNNSKLCRKVPVILNFFMEIKGLLTYKIMEASQATIVLEHLQASTTKLWTPTSSHLIIRITILKA